MRRYVLAYERLGPTAEPGCERHGHVERIQALVEGANEDAELRVLAAQQIRSFIVELSNKKAFECTKSTNCALHAEVQQAYRWARTELCKWLRDDAEYARASNNLRARHSRAAFCAMAARRPLGSASGIVLTMALAQICGGEYHARNPRASTNGPPLAPQGCKRDVGRDARAGHDVVQLQLRECEALA